MTSLLKGPPGNMKLIDASSAHQMFGRAGRPQFDSRGYIIAVAHEDDVRLFRWQEKYDQIPEDAEESDADPREKESEKETRREGFQYWTERQFQTLREAPPAKLASRGRMPWRLLAFFIRKSGTVIGLQEAVRRRLLDSGEKDDANALVRMLMTLEAGGFITLDPPPPKPAMADWMRWPTARSFHFGTTGDVISKLIPALSSSINLQESRWVSDFMTGLTESETAAAEPDESGEVAAVEDDAEFGEGVEGDDVEQSSVTASPKKLQETPQVVPDVPSEVPDDSAEPARVGLLGQLIQQARTERRRKTASVQRKRKRLNKPAASDLPDLDYEPRLAIATEQMELLFSFRSINSLYGVFLPNTCIRRITKNILRLLRKCAGSGIVCGRCRPRIARCLKRCGRTSVDKILNPILLSRGLIGEAGVDGLL